MYFINDRNVLQLFRMDVHSEGRRAWLSDGAGSLLPGQGSFFLRPNIAEEENNLPPTSSRNMLILFFGLSPPDLVTPGRSPL